MAYQLKAPVALAEAPGSVSSTLSGDSQLPVTPATEDPTPYSDLQGH